MSLMYEKTLTWNPFIGCEFNCSYCYASKVKKRHKHLCERCGRFEPHEHPERLDQKFPKGSQVFVCSLADISFATEEYRRKIYAAIEKQLEVAFLLQSKNLGCFIEGAGEELISNNAIVGTTIETNDYRTDRLISKAPVPRMRYVSLCDVDHHRKYVTIEPIMEFYLDTMVGMIREIHPEFVYIGYDNHKHKLPEPTWRQTNQLIYALMEFTEVRQKTIREAWWG